MTNKTAMACMLLSAATLVTVSFPSTTIARDNQIQVGSVPMHSSTRKTGTANLLAWDFDDDYGYGRGYNSGYGNGSGYGYGSGYGTYRTYTRYGDSSYGPGYGYNTRYVPVYSNDYGYGSRRHGAGGLVNEILNRIR